MGRWVRRFGCSEAGGGGAVLVRASVLMALVVLGVLGMSSAASAATFTVNDATDAALSNSSGTTCVSTNSGGCTLRAAVQAADNTGGSNTITLPAGTFTLSIGSATTDDPSTGDLDVTGGDNLTINGAGASSTVINANHIDRAFAVDAPADSLSISGVTITGGDADVSSASTNGNSTAPEYGGAIYNDGTLTVTNSALDHDQAYYEGGGIYSDTGAVSTTVSASDVSYDNASDEYAGGIEVDGGNMSISGSTIEHDSATDSYDGGVVWDSGGTGSISGSVIDYDSGWLAGGLGDYASGPLTVTGSDISHDSGQYEEYPGGGVYYSGSGALSITSSAISDDSAGYGGGVYLEGSAAVTLSDDTLADDSVDYYYGGAVYDENSDPVTMTGDTFTGDTAYYGGALYFDGDTEVLSNDTFDGNSGYYGVIYLDTTGASLSNDTIANNQGSDGGGIAYPSYLTSIVNTIVADNQGGNCYDGPAGTSADAGYNLDSDSTCFAVGASGLTPEASGDQVSVNPDLGSLSSNGGPTQTDALLSGSPAIGRALSASCPATDQRGVPRPAACDIGAYQTAGADLALSESGPAAAAVGSPVTYTLTATNNGPASAIGVVLTDAIPAGTTYFSSSSSQGACSGTSTVVCSLGTLDSSHTGTDTSATVSITVVASATGLIKNTATVASLTPDPTTANNTASASTAVTSGPTVTVLSKPVVITGAASQITTTKAKLSGIINPAEQATTYSVQYGTSKHYGKTAKGKTLKAGSTPEGVVISVKALKAGKTYYFRIVAKNASGTSYGQAVKFKTKKKKKK